MFSILQKPQEAVNAEDLEALQNEIERCLVDNVTQRWELERELLALNSASPESANLSSNAVSLPAPQSTNTSLANKRNSSQKLTQNDIVENSNDGFKITPFGANDNAAGVNSAEDSVSSEGSLVSSLTTSTIIAALPDSGSQSNTYSSNSVGQKRSSKSSSDRPSKRFRQNSSNSTPSTGNYTKRHPHSKHRSKIIPSKFRNSIDESRTNNKLALGSAAPDKLWPFVEQFCSAPTDEQMKELDEMIKAFDNDKEYFKIPSLGKKDAPVKDSPSKLDNGKNQKKIKKPPNSDDESSLGALTQRLVSSLIEESDDKDESSKSSDTQANKKSSKSKTGKSLDLNNAHNLERKIRQELEEHEILDQQDDIPYSSEDDEVLRELVSCQHELLTIQRQNKEAMQSLYKKAKKHLELESEREKLREANADVITAYQRLIQCKQRKRNPTKKEKDAAWKALKVQENIFKRCDDLYMSSSYRVT